MGMNHESASGGSADRRRQLRFDGPPEGEYLYRASSEELESIRTKPGRTATGRPFDWMVRRKVARGEWRLECVRPDILGLERPLEIYRAKRRGHLVMHLEAEPDAHEYCPGHWADLAIGRGACGLRGRCLPSRVSGASRRWNGRRREACRGKARTIAFPRPSAS